MRRVNNYFKAYCAAPIWGVFPFDANDAASVQAAWDKAIAFRKASIRPEEPLRGDDLSGRYRLRPPNVISVFAPVVIRGTWSAAQQIGTVSLKDWDLYWSQVRS